MPGSNGDKEWVGTSLHIDEIKTIKRLAGDRRWRQSQMIAELIREAPTFKKAHKPVGAKGKRTS